MWCWSRMEIIVGHKKDQDRTVGTGLAQQSLLLHLRRMFKLDTKAQ